MVVPVFDERDNVRPLVAEIFDALADHCDFEVLFVDDCSRDGTRQVLESLVPAVRFDLRVLAHDRRRGQSQAVVTGARAARGDWIVTLDGDGQNVPADILPMLSTLVAAHGQDPDVVCIAGIRRTRRDNLVRRLSSRVANGVRRLLLDDGMPDTGCGLKIFRREAFLALPLFDHAHRFIPALFRFSGGTVLTAPVAHRPRRRGVSKYGVFDRLWAGLYDLLGVCWLRRRAIFRPWRAIGD